MELCLSALRFYNANLKTWGISATIGNLDEAKKVLIGKKLDGSYVKSKLIRSTIRKQIEVEVVSPKNQRVTVERSLRVTSSRRSYPHFGKKQDYIDFYQYTIAM